MRDLNKKFDDSLRDKPGVNLLNNIGRHFR